jgi:tetratricopeptide (TPR) repeat protein
MIVKNESHVILPTLENLIRDFFSLKNITGELMEHEWVNFGHNRTKALEGAFNKTDYVFIFDADDKIHGSLNFDFLEDPNQKSIDAYTFTIGTSFVYKRVLLMNNRMKWQYRGVLHEYLAPLEPGRKMNDAHVPGDCHVESCRTGSRNMNPHKYVDDANVLKHAYEVEKDRDPELAMRYVFYCAQSYRDAGPEYTDDAIAWYKRCLDLPIWDQEKYCSCLTLGFLSIKKRELDAALKYFLRTIEYDGERIEGIVQAMEQLQDTSNHMFINALYHRFKGYNRNPKDKLFLFKCMYLDELEYQNSLSAYYAHDLPSGYECCKRILLNRVLPANRLHQTVLNLKFYLPCAAQDDVMPLFYAVDELISNANNCDFDENQCDVWNALFERCRPALTAPPLPSLISELVSQNQKQEAKANRVLLTFTTCKRLDLFKQTVHSMLNHWEDIDAVDAWFCVDDNSSEADRAEMRALFPWIEYCMKPADQRGHASSMNMIWDRLSETQPKYWIHMEDDFLFHTKMRYVETAIAAIESNDCVQANVKQVLFNRNYGETVENYNIGGHVACGHIALHRHMLDADFKYVNCHYWPHYSFRPSLIEVAAIMELGKFKPAESITTFFEMEYAQKWTRRGFTSAFFNKITNRHIGRLTNLSNGVLNAYQLNDQKQFNELI